VLKTLLFAGNAYAELAGLPPITGLDTSSCACGATRCFGPSRILVLRPGSSLVADDRRDYLPLIAAQGGTQARESRGVASRDQWSRPS